MRQVKFMVGKLMREQNLSANEIAKTIGVSHNTVLAYANNTVQRPDLEIVMKLMNYFQLNELQQLMYISEEQGESIPELDAA